MLFATSGGSGFGNTVKELQLSAPDAFIRINVACPKERLNDALNRLKVGIYKYLEDYANGC